MLDKNRNFRQSKLRNDKQNKSKIYNSQNPEIGDNEIVFQMIEFGINPIYARRIFLYIHPKNIEEALEFLSTSNDIIQHRFFQDRNKKNKFCYLCGDKRELHFDYISIIRNIKANNNTNLNKYNNIHNNNNIDKKPIDISNNIKINNNKNYLKKHPLDIFINLKNKNFGVDKYLENNSIDKSNNLKNKRNKEKEKYDGKKKSFDIPNNIKNNSNNKMKDNKFEIEPVALSKKDAFIINKNNYNKNIINEKKNVIEKDINIETTTLNTSKNSCIICGDPFLSNDENTLKNCGHSFCNICWYNFLDVKIKENQLTTIKCLNYECKEKLSDEFIFKILKNNDFLIKKYKKYKLELEIINNPNKKICPFPNCDSYLELKDKNTKYVNCLNGHTFCFFCQQKPHGEQPCDQILDSNIKEYALNNLIKKCPNCGIITEKDTGCNHMVCTKCQYQWCWLCNGKYNEFHFKKGKCKGLQYFRPKDEYEINLAFEGKIDLNEIQSQNNLDFELELLEMHQRMQRIQREFHMEEEVSNERRSYNITFNNANDDFGDRNNNRIISCKKKFLIFLIYLFFWHLIVSIELGDRIYSNNEACLLFFCLIIMLYEILYFLLYFAISIIIIPIYFLLYHHSLFNEE